jgi:plasmid stabilization system protein ParE
VTELRISEAAALSILEQADYYRQSGSEASARRWEASVDEAIRSLVNLPERGALCRFRSPALANIRWIPVPDFPKHLVFYRVRLQENSILIVEIQHGSRDLEAVLGADS